MTSRRQKRNTVLFIGLTLLSGGIAYGFALTRYDLFPLSLVRELRSHRSKSIALERQRRRLSEIASDTRHFDAVMVGDSITADGPWGKGSKPTERVGNHGIWGDSTFDLLRRIDVTERLRPRAVFLMIGVNDIIRGQLQELPERAKIIIDRLSSVSEMVYVQSILLTSGLTSVHNREILQVNEILEKMCSAVSNCRYLDINKVLSEDGALAPEYSTDGLHLTKGAYERWMAEIAPLQ